MDRHLDKLIALALDEDLGAQGDVTTRALVPPQLRGAAQLVAKEAMVLSGCAAFARVFALVDPSIRLAWLARDGASVKAGHVVATLSGPLAGLLVGERTALNLIQRTCGMATLAREAANATRGTRLKVLDTRKTAPGLRALSKQAVRDGGAHNHRFGLFDGVLIKDNHIAAVGGSVRRAVEAARAGAPRLVKVEVEVTSLSQLDEALDAGAHIVMLDNMSDADVKRAVARIAGRAEVEVSGGVTLERLPRLAALGVDYVSMGALTHSARAMDLSLEVETKKTSKNR